MATMNADGSARPRVAVLGLGRMGHPMAARVLDAGFPLTVWNRTPDRARDLEARGATVAATPAAAARDAAVIILMLTDPGAVERVLLGDDGVLGAVRGGATIVDCSTVGPEDSRTFGANSERHGARYLDAPVSGSVTQAESGTLVVLAGGDERTIAAVEPVMLAFAKQVVRAGPLGSGSALKLVINLLVGGLTELLGEAVVLAERAGLSKDVLRETLLTSVLGSPFLGYKAPQLLERRFTPLFTTELMLKDLNLVLHLAGDLGLALPATSTIRNLYAESAAAGRGAQDFSAVIEQLGDAAAAARPE